MIGLHLLAAVVDAAAAVPADCALMLFAPLLLAVAGPGQSQHPQPLNLRMVEHRMRMRKLTIL